jgi:HPt (histidine-containing phosphotransfer) domain-containing protein
MTTFDERELLELFGGNRELARMIVEPAAESLPRHVARLEQELAAQDWKAAERAAHTAGGLAGQIAATRLSQRFESIENILHDGGRVEAAALEALRAEVLALADILRNWK